jgi:hypothetical protein
MNYFSTLSLFLCFSLLLVGCGQEESPFWGDTSGVDLASRQEVIEAIDNLMRIADYALSAKQGTRLAPELDEETVYVRGKADGSIETERHTTLKGAPLITVSFVKGQSDLSTITTSKNYDSEAMFQSNTASSEQSTTVIGTASGQIKTTVLRDGTQQINTFRAPVITQTSDVITQRQGAADGAIEVIRTRTSDEQLLSKTLIYGQADGAIVNKRIFPDDSWTKVEVKGQADGTILKTVTESYDEETE